MSTSSQSTILAGGEFLVRHISHPSYFSPESFTEEQRSILEMCQEFVATEILPILDRIDSGEAGLMPGLLEKAGELGLLSAGISEEYGGLGLDIVTQMLVQEGLGHAHSFATAFAAQTGIGTYPIQYFGNATQKEQYLPGLGSGAIKSCYNLTEPNSGSDALSGKTIAHLSEDGSHYLLSGQKCWITNSGFADIFIVFAKVDGDKFTCFIVDRDSSGLTLGDEEPKMGIKGSSTRQVFYADVQVPTDRVVGEIGRGHKIAFNALNMGRIKLAAACIGASKRALNLSIEYAKERVQFRQAIAEFGAIQYKLAEMASRIYALSSAVYRASADIEQKEQALKAAGKSENEALLGAAEEYAVECAFLKVFGSEVQDYCVDEAVQIHGGNGFSADYPIDRCYRDSRITRIYEGTSEINRLLTINTLLKRNASGRLALSDALANLPAPPDHPETGLTGIRTSVESLKAATLLVLGTLADHFQHEMAAQQQLNIALADMVIHTYLAESVLLRAEKQTAAGADDRQTAIDLAQLWAYEAADKLFKNGKDCLATLSEKAAYESLLEQLGSYTKTPPLNVSKLRKSLAQQVVTSGTYCF